MKSLHLSGAAIALQLSVLATEYLGSVWPLWTGERVRLEIVPVDPDDIRMSQAGGKRCFPGEPLPERLVLRQVRQDELEGDHHLEPIGSTLNSPVDFSHPPDTDALSESVVAELFLHGGRIAEMHRIQEPESRSQ